MLQSALIDANLQQKGNIQPWHTLNVLIVGTHYAVLSSPTLLRDFGQMEPLVLINSMPLRIQKQDLCSGLKPRVTSTGGYAQSVVEFSYMPYP